MSAVRRRGEGGRIEWYEFHCDIREKARAMRRTQSLYRLICYMERCVAWCFVCVTLSDVQSQLGVGFSIYCGYTHEVRMHFLYVVVCVVSIGSLNICIYIYV